MKNKELIIHIPLTEDDSPSDIFGLLLKIFNGSIEMRHTVKKVSVNDFEIYGDNGLSKEFFNANS